MLNRGGIFMKSKLVALFRFNLFLISFISAFVLIFIFRTTAVAAGTILTVDCGSTATTVPDGSDLKPYKSLQAAINASAANTTILLKAGTCPEKVSILSKPGPLLIKAKVANSFPVINGAKKVSTTWTETATGSHIYWTRVVDPVAQVFYNGNFLKRARSPQTGFFSVGSSAPEYYNSSGVKISTPNLSVPLSDAAYSALSGKDLTNSVVTIRIIDYWYNSAPVKSFDTANKKLILYNKLGVDNLGVQNKTVENPKQPSECFPNCYLTYNAQKDWGFYLENKLWMLTSPGQWVYDPNDPNNRILYVRLPNDGNPTSADLKVSNESPVITISNSPNVTIEGLKIVNSGGNGIAVSGSKNLTLNGTEVSNIFRIGVLFSGASDPWIIKNSTIKDTGSDAIQHFYNAASTTTGVLIDTNIFDRIGSNSTLGPRFIRAAISLGSPNSSTAKIINNTMTNLGYVGIVSPTGGLIENNTITNFCMIADDCGGIHISDRQQFTTIRGNMLKSAITNVIGKPATRGSYVVAGIYLDDNSKNMTVVNNVVEDTDVGLMLHNAHDNNLSSNTFYNYKIKGVFAQEDDWRKNYNPTSGAFDYVLVNNVNILAMSNNALKNNIFASSLDAVPIAIETNKGLGTSRISGAVTGSYNTYLNYRNNTYLRVKAAAVKNGAYTSTAYGFDDLKTVLLDSSPFRPFNKILSPYYATSVSATPALAATSVNLNAFTVWSPTKSATKTPTNCSSFAANSLTLSCVFFVTNSSETGMGISPSFPVTLNHYYRVRVQLRSNTSSSPLLEFALHQNGPDSTGVGDYADIDSLNTNLSYQAQPGGWSTFTFYVKASKTITNARIDFTIPKSQQIVVGGMDVYDVGVGNLNYQNHLQLAKNISVIAWQMIACPSPYPCTGWHDLEAFPVFFPFTLTQRSSMVYWRDLDFVANDFSEDLAYVKLIELESPSVTRTNAAVAQSLGDIGPITSTYLSDNSGLLMPDKGDEVSFTINVPATGYYTLSLRARFGYLGSSMSYLAAPNNYEIFVDNTPVDLKADLNRINGVDSSYGGVYWGDLYTPRLSLGVGNRTIRIRVNSSWQMVDVFALVADDQYEPVNNKIVTLARPMISSVVRTSKPTALLSFTSNSKLATAYKVERKSGTGSFSTVRTLTSTERSWIDTSIVQGVVYRYRVTAVVGSVEVSSAEVIYTGPAN